MKDNQEKSDIMDDNTKLGELLKRMFKAPLRVTGQFYIVDADNRLVCDLANFSDDNSDRAELTLGVTELLNNLLNINTL